MRRPLSAALALTAAHLVAAAPAAAADVDIPHETYTLDNGLTVILHHDDSLPQVVVDVWYGVGSKDEKQGRSGFAHLFEHLMFMGTTRLPGSGFDDLMEAHGGWNNAWTSEDETNYYDVGPPELLPTLLWMEADRMSGLSGAMTQEKLDLQRDVVRNERRQSVEDQPYGVVWEALNPLLYPPDHPYGHTVIGTHEDLMAGTLGDVVEFFETWYVPNNARLVVAGDFDVDATKADIDRMFGHIPAGELPERAAPAPRTMPTTSLVEHTDQVTVPMTLMAWHSPPAFAPGDAALDMASAVLSDGRSSRLYQRLVEEEGLVLEVDAFQYSQVLQSAFIVEAKPADGHTLEEVEAAVMEELTRLATDGPTDEEMERALNNYEYGFLANMEAVFSRAIALARYHYLTGDAGYVSKDLARYRAVTAADVQQAVSALTVERRGVIHVLPAPPDAETAGGDQ